MLTSKYNEYFTILLKPFTEIVQVEYYDAIDGLCAKTRAQAEKIRKLEKQGEHLQYIMQCENIISEIEKYIKTRKSIYVPYVHELSEKVSDNHNCSTCSGKCSVSHDMHVVELNATNEEMKRVLSKLQVSTFPLYSETFFPEEYRLLRSSMTLLETAITELVFVENNFLIPKIVEAQKQINADSK